MTKEIFTLSKRNTKWWDADEAYREWESDFNKADENDEIKELLEDYIDEKAFSIVCRLDKKGNLVIEREWLDDGDYRMYEMRSEFAMFQINDELETLGWYIEKDND